MTICLKMNKQFHFCPLLEDIPRCWLPYYHNFKFLGSIFLFEYPLHIQSIFHINETEIILRQFNEEENKSVVSLDYIFKCFFLFFFFSQGKTIALYIECYVYISHRHSSFLSDKNARSHLLYLFFSLSSFGLFAIRVFDYSSFI